MSYRGQPTVTVLLPTYDVDKYVAAAVKSVLTQTFTDFELLIIDDGSRDATVEILAHHHDDRIRIIQTENRGLTSALNTGLEAARGEFVARMDGDDLCRPERLDRQIKTIRSAEDVALVGSWYDIIDEDGTYLATRSTPTSDQGLKARLLLHNPFCHGSVLFRKDAVTSLGGYRSEFKASQDYDLWLRLSEHHGMRAVPAPLYHWRLRPTGVGASARMLQRTYSKNARQCHSQRQRGLPEVLPSFQTRPSTNARGPTRRLVRASGYAAHKATIHLLAGRHWRARAEAMKSAVLTPWSLLAWASVLRTFRPGAPRDEYTP